MNVPTERKKDNDVEESTMEEFVVLKLPQATKLLVSGASHFRLIGLEEGKPFLQIGSEVFQGNFEKPLGSVLLFGNQEERDSQEAENVRPSSWGLIGYTEKTIKFERVQLRKKNTANLETVANSSKGHHLQLPQEENKK